MRIQNLMVIRLGVKTASGSLQGNVPLQTCLQTRTFGLARGESSPSRPTNAGYF
jgi:hypothetical protein